VDKPLLSHVTLVSTQEQKNFYDLLHFSPLKVCYLVLVPTSNKNFDIFCTPCICYRSLTFLNNYNKDLLFSSTIKLC
jgi:hypothetical protein